MTRSRVEGVAGSRAAPGEAPSEPETDLVGLLSRAGSGDPAALGEIYDATSPRVFGLVRYVVTDPEDAEEATLDTYAAIWRHAARFQPDRGHPMAWILSIARSKAIDALRARRRRLPTEPLRSGGLAAADPGPSPERQTSASERSIRVRGALACLAPEQREAIELAYFCGLSHREVAEALTLPVGTVKSRIRIGLRALRRALGEGLG